jgi:hypothetical protein
VDGNKWRLYGDGSLLLDEEMRSKWRRFLDGFDSIYVAIMFRLDYNDNIDRCAFFCEINDGWRQMYLEEDE